MLPLPGLLCALCALIHHGSTRVSTPAVPCPGREDAGASLAMHIPANSSTSTAHPGQSQAWLPSGMLGASWWESCRQAAGTGRKASSPRSCAPFPGRRCTLGPVSWLGSIVWVLLFLFFRGFWVLGFFFQKLISLAGRGYPSPASCNYGNGVRYQKVLGHLRSELCYLTKLCLASFGLAVGLSQPLL